MSSPSVETKRYFSVEEANKALPLVRMIVGDIVSHWQAVTELRRRLSVLTAPTTRKRVAGDPYEEELAQSRAELEVQEEKLRSYLEELERLGVELKGTDGLCDFPSRRDGREVCLCWRLGEPDVAFWHEPDAGFAGRQPLPTTARNRVS